MADFDLDAFVRDQAAKPFAFTWGGQEWTWPPHGDIRADVALRSGQFADALAFLMGEEGLEAFMATGVGLDVEALKALFEAYATHRGSSLGESSASSDSSKSTGKRSRQTSKSTTASRSRGSAKT